MIALFGIALLLGSIVLIWLARARDGIRVGWVSSGYSEIVIGFIFTTGFIVGAILLLSGVMI